MNTVACRCSNGMRILLIVPLLMGFLVSLSATAAFVPNDQLISDPAVSVHDPEFDNSLRRMVWQDLDGNLWLAGINPNTWVIFPVDGKGTLVDTGLSSMAGVGNGPEFFYGLDKTLITYTKTFGTQRAIATARQNASDEWVSGGLTDGVDRWRPFGTRQGTSGEHKLVYTHKIDETTTGISWRTTDDPASEKTITTHGDAGSRWFENEDAFLVGYKDGGVHRLYRVDALTQAVEQISHGADQVFNGIPWFAPEAASGAGQTVISASVNFDTVGMFLKVDGVWYKIYSVTLPSTYTYVSSPEPFVYKGRSFVTVIAAESLAGVEPLPYVPTVASEVWVISADLNNPFARKIDDGTVKLRLEPEPLILKDDAVVYFSAIDDVTGNSTLHVADTGLGDDDWDDDTIVNRDDNCVEVSNVFQVDTDDDGLGNSCDDDDDNDGLDDITENALGTNARLVDTDGDGLNDFDEVNMDGDPSSYLEGTDTNPINADTDGDLLNDGEDLLPLIPYLAGDIAPLGAPDGVVNGADYLIAERIVKGQLVATPTELAHGDLYPPDGGDGIINVQDLLLIIQQ